MTATNKAFAYVFNTTSEDQKVSKVLSGWESRDRPSIPSIGVFDSYVRGRIRELGRHLFLSSFGLGDPSMNLDPRVLDLLTATLIKFFPEVNERFSLTPYRSPMRNCCMALDIKMSELLAWSNKLHKHEVGMSDQLETSDVPFTKEVALINHQNIVIGELINLNRELTERLEALEKRLYSKEYRATDQDSPCRGSTATPSTTKSQAPSQATKSGRADPISASSLWFEWYTRTPRL